jgi:murein DD-endopeptidase MepM/ murein hydrolase activator NlpD
LFFYTSIFLISFFVFAAVIIGLFTDFYNDFKLNSLKRFNAALKKQLEEMKEEVANVQSEMEKLEVIDDEDRTINELQKIDKDMRGVGVGGTAYSYSNELADIPFDTRVDISTTRTLIDQLERRIQLLDESRGEIETKIGENKQNWERTPSIRPVRKGRITDFFGMRLDPIVEMVRMHEGIDIAAPGGTEVVAPATGVVKFVKKQFKRNRGYGKEVLIDHGNGIKTHYAHMHEIFVRAGQKINRWDKIGTVGKTGRATGPHLHYEVIVNNKKVNPIEYFLEK